MALDGHITISSATGLPCTGACVFCGLFVMCIVNGTSGEGPTRGTLAMTLGRRGAVCQAQPQARGSWRPADAWMCRARELQLVSLV